MNPIKSKMDQLDVSFTELQQESGLSKSTVARVLKGDKLPDNTRVSTLFVIAKTLECEVSDFFPRPLPKFESAQGFGLKITDVTGANNLEKVKYNCLVKYENGNYWGQVYFVCSFFRDKQRKKFKDVFINVKDDLGGVISKFIKDNLYDDLLNLITEVLKACEYPFLAVEKAEKENNFSGTIQYVLDGRLSVQGDFAFNAGNLTADHFLKTAFI